VLSHFTSLCHRHSLWQTGVRTGALALAGFLVIPVAASAQVPIAELSGAEIMAQSQRRHQQFPYVYEEQSMILIDAKGHRKVRRSRFYTRIESGGNVKFLLIFDQPETIRGVALIANRGSNGQIQSGVYLPAFGQELKRPRGSGLDDQFFGTDFTVADLTPEPLEEFRYARQNDRRIEGQEYFVVDAFPRVLPGRPVREFGLRQHLIRQDNFMIVQTNVYDANLRFYKSISYTDLKQVDGDSWRANTIIAHNFRANHRTVLKVDRRVYSQDYVPASLFEEASLLANRHVSNPASGAEISKVSDAERTLMLRAREPASDQ